MSQRFVVALLLALGLALGASAALAQDATPPTIAQDASPSPAPAQHASHSPATAQDASHPPPSAQDAPPAAAPASELAPAPTPAPRAGAGFAPLGVLPIGAGGRVRVTQPGGERLQGILAGVNDRSLTLALRTDNPLVPLQQIEVPLTSVTRVELSTGKRNFAWVGAIIGAVLLGASGFSDPVNDSPDCGEYLYSTEPCSRAEAVGIAIAAGALVGAGVGFFVKQERWTPVAIEALGAPPAAAAPRPPSVTAGVRLRF